MPNLDENAILRDISMSSDTQVAAIFRIDAIDGAQPTISVLDIASGIETHRTTIPGVDVPLQVESSASGRYIAYQETKNGVKIRDIVSNTVVYRDTIDKVHGSFTAGFGFTNDGSLVAMTVNGTLVRINLKDGRQEWVFPGSRFTDVPQQAHIAKLQVSNQSRSILVEISNVKERTYRVLDLDTGKIVAQKLVLDPLIEDVAIINDRYFGIDFDGGLFYALEPESLSPQDPSLPLSVHSDNFNQIENRHYLNILTPDSSTSFLRQMPMAGGTYSEQVQMILPNRMVNYNLGEVGVKQNEIDNAARLAKYSISYSGNRIAIMIYGDNRISLFPTKGLFDPVEYTSESTEYLRYVGTYGTEKIALLQKGDEILFAEVQLTKLDTNYVTTIELPNSRNLNISEIPFSKVSSTGRILFAVDERVYRYDINTKSYEELFQITAGKALSIDWSLDEKKIITGSLWNVAQVWSGENNDHLFLT